LVIGLLCPRPPFLRAGTVWELQQILARGCWCQSLSHLVGFGRSLHLTVLLTESASPLEHSWRYSESLFPPFEPLVLCSCSSWHCDDTSFWWPSFWSSDCVSETLLFFESGLFVSSISFQHVAAGVSSSSSFWLLPFPLSDWCLVDGICLAAWRFSALHVRDPCLPLSSLRIVPLRHIGGAMMLFSGGSLRSLDCCV